MLDLDDVTPAIEALGPWAIACRSVIIDAIERARPGNNRISVIRAAGRISPPTANLVAVLRRQAASHLHSTSKLLSDLGPAAAPALPEVTALLSDTQFVVRVNAARALWRITGDAGELFAIVRADPTQHYPLRMLAELGPDATAVADLLPPLFDSDDEWLAVCAAVAHWHITRDATPVIPVLLEHIACGPRGIIAVRCLGDIGPTAAAAIPLLRAAIDSPHRQVQFITDDAIIEDEARTDTCTNALTPDSWRRSRGIGSAGGQISSRPMAHSDRLPTIREAASTRRPFDGRPGLGRGVGVTLMSIGVLWLVVGIGQPWTVWGQPKTIAGTLWSCHTATASAGGPVDRCWLIGSDDTAIAKVAVPGAAGAKLDGTHVVRPNPAYANRTGWFTLAAVPWGLMTLARGRSHVTLAGQERQRARTLADRGAPPTPV